MDEVYHLSFDTTVFQLIDEGNFETRDFAVKNSLSWKTVGGYKLRQSPIIRRDLHIPDQVKFKLRIDPSVPNDEKMLWYGYVNAMLKGRILPDPFIICHGKARLIKKIDLDYLKDIKIATLDQHTKPLLATVITPNFARKLCNHLLTINLTKGIDLELPDILRRDFGIYFSQSNYVRVNHHANTSNHYI